MVRKAKGTTLTAIYQEKLAGIDVEIRRVHGRMFRWANRLDKLIKSKTRFERLLAEAKQIKPEPKPVETDHLSEAQFHEFVEAAVKQEVKEANARINDDPLDVRNQPWNQSEKKDLTVAAEIRQQQAQYKKLKRLGQAVKRKAKSSGELRKMPLTGKAALAAIRDAK